MSLWKQILLLSKVQLCNIGGINQLKYSKDKKQKNRFILQASVYIILGLFIAMYAGGITYSYIIMGLSEFIFPIIMISISLLALFFTIYKASNVIFNLKTYDMLITLPVSTTSIVVSRFLSLYVQNIGMTALFMIPMIVVYGIMIDVGILFYVLGFIGTFLIPLFPITIAVAIGAVITGIASRMKHKNIVTIILSFIAIIAIIVIPMLTSSNMSLDTNSTINQNVLHDILKMAQTQLYGIYPLAKWFAVGVTKSNMSAYVAFTSISIGFFVTLVYLIQWKFKSISSALYSKRASNQYVMQELSQNSVFQALYKRELKLYFSSSIYVLNTLVGYILMVVFSVVIFIIGIEKIKDMTQISGISKMIPLAISLMGCITSTTVSSISMEGKHWWITQSLPIASKELFNCKILVNLTIALPCYLLTEIFLMLALRPTILDGLWIILIPLLYIGFTSVLGITMNCKFPSFNWETEAEAVKQGGAMMFSMLIGMGSVFLPLLLVMALGEYAHFILMITCIIVIACTTLLYIRNQKLDIRSIH
ncbi:MAG: putative ABC transporter permease subunit [Coprobacillaceae bacterium]